MIKAIKPLTKKQLNSCNKLLDKIYNTMPKKDLVVVGTPRFWKMIKKMYKKGKLEV